MIIRKVKLQLAFVFQLYFCVTHTSISKMQFGCSDDVTKVDAIVFIKKKNIHCFSNMCKFYVRLKKNQVEGQNVSEICSAIINKKM